MNLRAPLEEPVLLNLSSTWRTLLAAGAIAGALPFVVSVSTWKSTSVNGVASSTYRDWVAIGGGGAAIVFALLAIASLARSKRVKQIGIGLAVVALGGFQIARGVGVFVPTAGASPDPPMTSELPETSAIPVMCPDGDACDDLADLLEHEDPEGAQVARVRSCNVFEHELACEEAAQAYASGAAGSKDLVKALAMNNRGCALGNDESCTWAGVAYFQGKFVDQDVERGLELLVKGCDDEDLLACAYLGYIYKDGIEGVAVDLAKAFAYAARSCGDGHYAELNTSYVAGGCEIAGMLALEGKGIEKDGPRAIRFFAEGCDRSADRCFELARAHEVGRGGLEKDPKAAREIYKRGCDAGDLASCNNLASLLLDGLGGPRDEVGARKLFKHACDAGFEHSCKVLK